MRYLSNKFLKGTAGLVLAAGLILTGCDSDSDSDNDGGSGEVTISGTVTDNDGFAGKGNIEGAAVVASEVNAQGNLSQGAGSATTNASGHYTLETEANSDVMVITATSGSSFRGTAMAMAESNSGAVEAMEINSESTAEADVYVEAKRQDNDSEAVTPADVAFFVDTMTAAEIKGGSTSESQVAAAVRAAIEAEHRSYADNGVSESQMDDAAQNKNAAFIRLQADLSGSSSSAEQQAAASVFLEAMADAWLDSGVNENANAQARQTAAVTVKALASGLASNARLELRKHAEWMAATSTTTAVEAEFESNSELSSHTSAVAQAGVELRQNIMSASSEAQIDAAWNAYENDANAEIMSGLSLDVAIGTIISGAIASLRTDYESDISSASSVDAVVNAKADFYSNVKTSVEDALTTSANAESSARAWALVSAH